MRTVTDAIRHVDPRRGQNPSVLWIDDMVDPQDSVVRLLRLHGFDVTCACSGQAGMAAARKLSCDAVILDLRLPDMHGLKVLETLHQSHPTPVLILSGYIELESPLAALRLGAAECASKPIDGDELAETLTRIIQRHGAAAAPAVPLSPTGAPVDRVLVALDAVTPQPCGAALAVVAECLFRALRDPALRLREFIGCAETLRRTMTGEFGDDVAAGAAGAIRVFQRTAVAGWRADHRAVREAITLLESAPHRWREEQMARNVGISRAHFGRLVRTSLGLGYRELRRFATMRIAVRQLLSSTEHIAQIAYSLGFDHPSQFDHEFRTTFGCSPRELRRTQQQLNARSI